MKQILFFFLICSCAIVTVHAQEGNTAFLFEKYQNGIIYFKDGRQYTALLNYDVYGKRFLFVDESDNDYIKEFAEPHLVSLVKIGDRTFMHDPKDIKEVLQMQPPVLVEYRATLRDRGKNAGYGGRSSTAAISSYSGLRTSDGAYHKFEVESAYEIADVKKTYYIEVSKKKKRFSTEKDFLKIYSTQKDTLKDYINQHKIDFNSTEQVVQLCNFATTLK